MVEKDHKLEREVITAEEKNNIYTVMINKYVNLCEILLENHRINQDAVTNALRTVFDKK